jgi:hypothetical protein
MPAPTNQLKLLDLARSNLVSAKILAKFCATSNRCEHNKSRAEAVEQKQSYAYNHARSTTHLRPLTPTWPRRRRAVRRRHSAAAVLVVTCRPQQQAMLLRALLMAVVLRWQLAKSRPERDASCFSPITAESRSNSRVRFVSLLANSVRLASLSAILFCVTHCPPTHAQLALKSEILPQSPA